MNALQGLPEQVLSLIRSASVCEFATVSGAGVPIDTPTLCFHPDDLRSIDMATGLAYPAKAERARRNPKVGLLIEGKLPGEPIISVAGVAKVRDGDIQANTLRYIDETSSGPAVSVPWPVAREAVWYWCRILISVQPKRILWWDSASALDGPPQAWEAPADRIYEPSDPAPPGKTSEAPHWPQTPWPELAAGALAKGMAGHLTLFDGEGYPLPFRASDIQLTPEGFTMKVPAGAPWAGGGKATLSFEGLATFVGSATRYGSEAVLLVERALPVLPLTGGGELWGPRPGTREALMGRLTHELDRRGQGIPAIPSEKPAPTPGAMARAARLSRLMAGS